MKLIALLAAASAVAAVVHLWRKNEESFGSTIS
jgi:hypothetical protein